MEILVVVALWTVVVKRGVEDILHTARGGTPHRYAAAKARRSSGAAGRYWGTLWDDTFEDLLKRHNEKRAKRDIRAPRPERNPSQMRTVLAESWDDLDRYVRATWRHGWDKAARRQQDRRLRRSAGRQTVPGVVVPNQDDQDERRDEPQDRPQDEPGPDPRTVPTPDGGTDLQFGDDPTDPTGTKQCPECHGTGLVDGEVCLSCRNRQEQRNQHHEQQEVDIDGQRDAWQVTYPNGQTAITNDSDFYQRRGYPLTKVRGSDEANGFRVTHEYPEELPTQEGSTTMTAAVTEVVGLSQTIRFCEDSAAAFRAQAQATEHTVAAIAAGDVSGPAAAKLAHAMELSMAAAEAMDEAAAEFKPHLAIQEQYNANPGAGTREFVTAGQ